MFAPFMVNAWIVGTLVAILGGAVGFFIVLRGAAFVAHAIPNGSFAGAAAAALVGTSTLLGLAVFSLAGAAGIGWLSRRGRADVATALTLVFLLGLGALFLSLSGQYGPEVDALLFGEVLGVSANQVLPTAALVAVSLLALALVFRPLLLASVLADSSPAGWTGWLFLLIVALATTVTVPVVGTTLIFSLLIGPAAGARALADRPGRAFALSVGLAALTVWIAIAASFASGWPVGFWVGLLAAGWYLLGRAYTALQPS
jgi:zinc/manganese transport system permease protein